MTAVIETRHLTKEFKSGRGCHDVSITVQPGEIFGLLGPNGAGKSTLVKMLVGLIRPTSGEARVLGLPAGSLEARRQIGYLPELFRYQEWLTGREVLRLHARLCRLAPSSREHRISEVLDEVGLADRGDERVRRYSKGMQQRLGIACALIGNPQVLFLDEPVSALDPAGRHEIRKLLLRLRAAGKTVFLNTHLLEDVEAICTSVALLADGRVRAQGTVEDILRPKPMWECIVGGWMPESMEELMAATNGQIRIEVVSVNVDGTAVLHVALDDREQLGWLNHTVMERGLTLYETKPLQHRLESWFLSQTSVGGERG
jgi:ABC-2 type transport system ATP-binding protein